MKLHTSPTSPFGRKCRLVAYVAGSQMENVDANYKSPEYTAKLNPLGKVPSLELDDGRVLIDSPVIAAYVAAQGDASKIYPEGEAKWAALSLEALADGLTDAAVLAYLEQARGDGERSKGWLDKQFAKMNAGLDAVETLAGDFDDATHIGVLAVAGGLSWIDLKGVGGDWREGRPNLSAWWDRFTQSDCWTGTAAM